MQTPVCVPIVSTRSQVYGNTRARVGGLKGRRFGDARNPGPAEDQADSTANEFMEVVSALEFDLTQLDSDHDMTLTDLKRRVVQRTLFQPTATPSETVD